MSKQNNEKNSLTPLDSESYKRGEPMEKSSQKVFALYSPIDPEYSPVAYIQPCEVMPTLEKSNLEESYREERLFLFINEYSTETSFYYCDENALAEKLNCSLPELETLIYTLEEKWAIFINEWRWANGDTRRELIPYNHARKYRDTILTRRPDIGGIRKRMDEFLMHIPLTSPPTPA